jgi:hypothetical protein
VNHIEAGVYCWDGIGFLDELSGSCGVTRIVAYYDNVFLLYYFSILFIYKYHYVNSLARFLLIA